MKPFLASVDNLYVFHTLFIFWASYTDVSRCKRQCYYAMIFLHQDMTRIRVDEENYVSDNN